MKGLKDIRNDLLEAIKSGNKQEAMWLINDLDTHIWKTEQVKNCSIPVVGRTLVCDCSRKGTHLSIEERQNKCIGCKKPITN